MKRAPLPRRERIDGWNAEKQEASEFFHLAGRCHGGAEMCMKKVLWRLRTKKKLYKMNSRNRSPVHRTTATKNNIQGLKTLAMTTEWLGSVVNHDALRYPKQD